MPPQLQNKWLSPCAASRLPGVRQDTRVSYATRRICIRTRSPHTLLHEGGVRTSGDLPNASITRSIVRWLRFFTLYGAFLVKSKFSRTLLFSIHLASPPVGWVSARRFLPFLGMEAPLLGRAERSIPAARKGRAFRRAGLTAKARAER